MRGIACAVSWRYESQQFEELFYRIPGLLDNRYKRPAFQVAAVAGHGNAHPWLYPNQVIMGPFGVVNEKPCSLECPQNFGGL